ncbi:uncharacterized protein LOC134837039 [Culicoides brevitarsis]|uniref:uncharacterized protein LOC134837039 n=1 Tax=Culicoides brevitarsis TaxID=469753 RepID=UPI00307CC518
MAELPAELALDNFESAIASIDVCDMDVIDEVGESDEEEEPKSKKKRDEKSHRSHRSSRDRSHGSRNRSRSPRRYGRSRSRDRIRRRTPPKRKSPLKKGGAADFLKEIQQEFGEFEGLKEVQKKVETHTILNERDRDRNRVGSRGRNNFYQNNQRRQQNNQSQYQNMNGMQNQMMMNPMNGMGMNPMMMMGGPVNPYQMQMMDPGYCGGLAPPGVDPPVVNYSMPGPYMQPQAMPMPEPVPPVVQNPVVNEGRNASPPPDIGLGSISSQLLSEDRLPLSEYLETQVNRCSGKAIEPRSVRERALSKCKAALHRLENASQFNNKFLHVIPAYPSDESEPIGASPILPSKQNPVFRFSSKQKDAIKNSHPYPTITRNVRSIIRQLGIDESVIARRLASGNREEALVPAQVIQPKPSKSISTAIPVTNLPVRPQMRDQSCQTAVFSCPKCEDRYENCLNVGTQTTVIEKYSGSCQTDDADFTLAKLKLRNWEKKKQSNDIERLRDFQREYGVVENDSDEEFDDRKPIRPGAIGPPGFRELPSKNPRARTSYEDRNPYYGRY